MGSEPVGVGADVSEGEAMTISDEMKRCLDFVRRHGGIWYHFSGNYWSVRDRSDYTGEHFSTKTVEALRRRGLLEFSDAVGGFVEQPGRDYAKSRAAVTGAAEGCGAGTR